MSLARILRLLPAAGLALSIAGCARCPYPQTQPAPPNQSWGQSGAAPVLATDTLRVALVQIRTTGGGASGEFAPRVLRARRGDLLRFQMMDGDAHHNVAFAHFSRDKAGIRLPPEGPYLTTEGQSWQIRVDLAPGTYEFACIPHAEAHRGTLIVEE
jgi:plastocyanin